MFHPDGPTFWELTRQALSSTEHGYDLLAGKFDVTPFRTPDWMLDVVAPIIAAGGQPEAGLDLCCGTGAATRSLASLCRRRVVGVDFSENMLCVARQRSAAENEPVVEYLRQDVLSIDFQDEFDVATCFGALGHILPRDQLNFVERVARSLRVGGRFYFATGYLPHRFSKGYWLSRGFNTVMRVRNLLVQPPFVMYYLNFLVPEATDTLEQVGFHVNLHNNVFPPPYHAMCVVEATKR